MRHWVLIGSVMALAAAPAHAQLNSADIDFNLAYQQVAPNTLTLTGSFFDGRVFTGQFDTGTLTYPGGTQTLTPIASGPPGLEYQTAFLADQAALEASFPAGDYTFSLSNSNGDDTATTTITHGATLFAGAAPVIANFTALQTIDPTQNFTLQLAAGFSPPAGATSSFTFVNVFDQATNAVVYSNNFALPSTTDFLIGANTLLAGHDYAVETIFSNRVDGQDVNGVQTTDVSDVRSFALFGVAAVPEPASWAMLIGGFGVVGGAMRRRGGYVSLTA